MKKGVLIAVFLIAVSPMFGLTNFCNAADPVKLRFAHVLDTRSPIHQGALKFKELVESRSGGKIIIEVYPHSQLGGERDIAEGIRLGSIDMGEISCSALSGLIRQAGIFNLPYLFRTKEHAVSTVEGPIGKNFSENVLGKIGLRGLGFNHHGYRHVFTNGRKVKELADLKGLKIRIQEDPIQRDTWETLGASPVPIPYPELYTSLQTGVIDAAEQPPGSILSMRFYEVSKVLIMTSHLYQVSPILINKKVYEKLDADSQKIVHSSGVEAAKFQREAMWAYNDNAVDELKKLGMEIVKIDYTPFIEKTAPVRERASAKIEGGAEMLKEILAAK
jgi:tripartite ATP-independent transporter DctP family solute receptor